MCNPIVTAIAGIGLSIAGSTMEHKAKANEAEKNNNYELLRAVKQERYRLNNALNARKGVMFNTTQARNNLYEYEQATGVELGKTSVANQENQSTAQVSASESNVAGNSIEMLLDNYDRADAINEYIARKNLGMKSDIIDDQIEAIRIQGQGQINSAQSYTPSYQSSPSIFSSLLGGINPAIDAGVKGYNLGNSLVGKGSSKP